MPQPPLVCYLLDTTNEQVKFTPEERRQLRELNPQLQDAPDASIDHFLAVARQTGLNPWLKQIYMVARWDSRQQRNNYTVQTGIDGFRTITRNYADMRGESVVYEDTIWYDAQGREYPFWPFSPKNPAQNNMPNFPLAAKVTIHVGNSRVSHIATWDDHHYYSGTK